MRRMIVISIWVRSGGHLVVISVEVLGTVPKVRSEVAQQQSPDMSSQGPLLDDARRDRQVLDAVEPGLRPRAFELECQVLAPLPETVLVAWAGPERASAALHRDAWLHTAFASTLCSLVILHVCRMCVSLASRVAVRAIRLHCLCVYTAIDIFLCRGARFILHLSLSALSRPRGASQHPTLPRTMDFPVLRRHPTSREPGRHGTRRISSI